MRWKRVVTRSAHGQSNTVWNIIHRKWTWIRLFLCMFPPTVFTRSKSSPLGRKTTYIIVITQMMRMTNWWSATVHTHQQCCDVHLLINWTRPLTVFNGLTVLAPTTTRSIQNTGCPAVPRDWQPPLSNSRRWRLFRESRICYQISWFFSYGTFLGEKVSLLGVSLEQYL